MWEPTRNPFLSLPCTVPHWIYVMQAIPFLIQTNHKQQQRTSLATIRLQRLLVLVSPSLSLSLFFSIFCIHMSIFFSLFSLHYCYWFMQFFLEFRVAYDLGLIFHMVFFLHSYLLICMLTSMFMLSCRLMLFGCWEILGEFHKPRTFNVFIVVTVKTAFYLNFQYEETSFLHPRVYNPCLVHYIGLVLVYLRESWDF